MSAVPLALVWDLIARDGASSTFRRVAGSANLAATSMGRAVTRMNAAGRKMSVIGRTLTRGLTVPLLAVGALAVKAATDFNASMTRIQTQAGGSAKDVTFLTKRVLAMKGAQQGPNDLASALYHLKSVGLANVPALKALRVGSDLAAVGNANLEDTVNALAGAWRTGIKGATDFHDAAATINAVIGAGNMQLPDIIGALGTGILPTAKTFGLTLKDVGSALALFTDEGVPADAAATRLRMSFSLLGAPSEKAAGLLDSIGISGLQLADDMRKPNGLIAAIGDLKGHLEDPKYKLSLSEQAQLLSHAFGGGRSSSAILSLINNFDVLKQKQDQVTRSLGKYDAAVATQKATPQAKFHEALASLEKAGILLGNQLLPIATQFAHVLANVASGFNGLSGGAKHFVAEVGIGLLVLGPMLSLVGKLTRAIALMWAAGKGALAFSAGMRGVALAEGAVASKAYLAGGALTGMKLAAVRAGAAVAAVGVGFSIGRMTREASGGAKALGLLASVGTGAALGASFGPPGVAIGAVVGGLSDLVGGMGAVDPAAQEMAANVSSLTKTLEQDGLAVGKLTSAWIAHQLATNGVVDNLGALGLSYRTVTAAAHGNKDALDQVGQAMHNSDAAVGAGYKILKLAQAFDAARAKAKQVSAGLHVFGNSTAEVTAGSKRNADAISRMAAGSQDVAGAEHAASTATQILSGSLRQVAKDYLKATNAALGIAQSEAGFLDSLHSMTQAIKQSNGSLRLHSVAGRAAAESLYSAASGALAMDDGTRKGNKALLGQITSLRAHAIAAGADAGAVDKILGKLHLLPSQINMKLNVDTGASMAKLRAIQDAVNRLHGKTLFVGVAGGHTLGLASGGGLPNGVSAVGERGPELAIKSGKHVQILSNIASRKFLAATGIRAPGFAGGTPGVRMSAPNFRGPNAGAGQGGTKTIRIKVDMDDNGNWQSVTRDIVLDELDLDATIGGMR